MTISDQASLDTVVQEMTDAACRLRQSLEDSPDLRQASVLPDWELAQVYAHVDGVSRALARELEFAKRGEKIELYDGGAPGRSQAIAALAAKEQPELLGSLEEAFTQLSAAVARIGVEDLNIPTAFRNGKGTVQDVLQAARRELVIHESDLNLGVMSNQWSAAFCRDLIAFLEERVPEKTRLVLQPLGQQPITLSNGNTSGKSYVITGMMQDIAAWLAGRAPQGQVSAHAAADAVELPTLLPWPTVMPSKA